MSAASRQREYNRRYQGGFNTLEEFRAHQRAKIAVYLNTPEAIARRVKVSEEAARGRVPIKPGSDIFVEGVPYKSTPPPEIELDNSP